jgi:hypothetical protein
MLPIITISTCAVVSSTLSHCVIVGTLTPSGAARSVLFST